MVAGLFAPRKVRECELDKPAGHMFGNKVRIGSREPAIPEKEVGGGDGHQSDITIYEDLPSLRKYDLMIYHSMLY